MARNAKQILMASRKHVEKYGITGGNPWPPSQAACPRGLVAYFGFNGEYYHVESHPPALKALKALDKAATRIEEDEEHGLRAQAEAGRIESIMSVSNQKRAALAFMDRALALV